MRKKTNKLYPNLSTLLRGLAVILFLHLTTEIITAQPEPTPSPTAASTPKPSKGNTGIGGGERKGETTIIADKQADFDANENKAIFLGNVRVKDPEFYIECDKLTAYTNKTEGGLERAIAEGNVRVIQEKVGADGKKSKSTGKGQKLVWEAGTGIARLSGSAQMQQGINLHIAERADTVMVLSRDGQLTTQGPSRTVLKPEEKGDQ
jgi:lipopolysaccharide transport protein LptA